MSFALVSTPHLVGRVHLPEELLKVGDALEKHPCHPKEGPYDVLRLKLVWMDARAVDDGNGHRVEPAPDALRRLWEVDGLRGHM